MWLCYSVVMLQFDMLQCGYATVWSMFQCDYATVWSICYSVIFIFSAIMLPCDYVTALILQHRYYSVVIMIMLQCKCLLYNLCHEFLFETAATLSTLFVFICCRLLKFLEKFIWCHNTFTCTVGSHLPHLYHRFGILSPTNCWYQFTDPEEMDSLVS